VQHTPLLELAQHTELGLEPRMWWLARPQGLQPCIELGLEQRTRLLELQPCTVLVLEQHTQLLELPPCTAQALEKHTQLLELQPCTALVLEQHTRMQRLVLHMQAHPLPQRVQSV